MQMPTKNRGKSAAIVSDINLLSVNADLSTSPYQTITTAATSPLPLRIESVVPSRGKNVNSRFIRSYSTLNLNYLKTLISDSQRKNELLDQQLKESIQNVNAATTNEPPQNGKQLTANDSAANAISTATTTTSSSSSSSHTKFINNNIIGDTINQHQHGFWRIQRTQKEKERHPDRINLDRRGLTTLPIIENEPNLRLLSLQHNLINSFCVPAASHQPSDFGGNVYEDNDEDGCLSVTVECGRSEGSKKSIEQQPQRNIKSSLGNQSNNGRRLLRTQSIQKPLSSTAARNFTINNLPGMQQRLTNNKLNGTDVQCRKKGAPITRENSISSKNSTLASKSAFLHSKERYVLKKSNSFINNYSRHLVATKAHLGRLIQNRANANATVLAQQGSSFSSDSIPDVDLQPPNEMLIVKNDPFSGFAESLQNLVFLDLYDNQIERISNLDGLRNLTVLLLGKNRISDISGITSVKKTLRVLDLHGNKITTITNKICQLHELKSLNLAGNNLKQIQNDDFKDLMQLKELNIKRNRIKKICGFDDLISLERLWLCHNDLQKVEDMWCISKATTLREVTIENNPVSLAGDCVSFLVSFLPNLKLLSQMQVTDQVRRAAMNWRKNKELSDANNSDPSSDAYSSIRREEVISNARTNWELLRQQQPMSKISNYIQKSINNTAKQLQIVRTSTDLDIDSCSNLSDNVMVDRKVIRQKAQSNRKNLKKPMTAKMRRSLSQDNSSTVSNEFRLPPILPLVNGTTNSDPAVNLSSSSIATNADTRSSPFSSDAEDSSKKMDENLSNHGTCGVVETENIAEINGQNTEISSVADTDPTPSMKSDMDETQAIRLDENFGETHNEVDLPLLITENHHEDKQSVLIENSVKIQLENLPVSATIEKAPQRGKNMCKRSCNHPLQRSQTAKAMYSPMPTGTSTPTPKAPKQPDREREQGGDYLIEICGRYLNVYGSGAIKFIDRQWNAQKANDVHTLKFSYVNYNNVAGVFGRIKHRFPNAEHFSFRGKINYI